MMSNKEPKTNVRIALSNGEALILQLTDKDIKYLNGWYKSAKSDGIYSVTMSGTKFRIQKRFIVYIEYKENDYIAYD